MDIMSSLAQGNYSSFLNPIVHMAWIMEGGFILWNLWNEINSIIFKEKSRMVEVLKEVIIQNIR